VAVAEETPAARAAVSTKSETALLLLLLVLATSACLRLASMVCGLL
jgi:hypothetical protein